MEDHNRNTLHNLPQPPYPAYPPYPPARQPLIPVVTNFTDVTACVDYLVPLVLHKKTVSTYLNSLTTDKGIVITNMPIYKYGLEYDIDIKDKITLNALEFRDGLVYEFVSVNKLFGWVTSKHIGLGNLVSIDITTTLMTCSTSIHEEHGGEHEHRANWL